MKEFVEIQNLGFNLVTLSALATVIFTIFQGYGFLKQGQKIWQTRSVESLSPTMFFLFFFYFISFTIYGFSKNSLAMIFNGLLFFTCAPIVVGIIKFGKLRFVNWVSFFLFANIVPLMIFISNKDILLSGLLALSFLTLVGQPLAMIKERRRGVVEIKLITIFAVTALFWLVYSTIIGNWPLQLFNCGAVTIYVFIMYLYYKYK